MRWLIFFMFRARVIEVRQFVEGKLAVTLCRTDQMRLWPAIGRQLRQLFHAFVTGLCRIPIPQPATARDHLQCGVEHTGKHAMLKSLMQVTNFPEFFFDPARFDFLLKLAEHRRWTHRLS